MSSFDYFEKAIFMIGSVFLQLILCLNRVPNMDLLLNFPISLYL